MRTFLLASISAVVLASSVVAFAAQRSEVRAVQHLRAGQEALRSERWEIAEREFKAALAEKAGYRVSDRFKEDLKTAARKAGKG